MSELTSHSRTPQQARVMSRRDTLRAMGVVAVGVGLGAVGSPGVASAAPADDWLGFIMSHHSGHVMDVAWGSRADGAAVIQWPLHGGPNQIFRFEYLGGSRYRIVATHSNKVLTIVGGSTADGGQLVQASWNGGLNQVFVEPNYGWQPTPLLRVLHNRRAKALQPEGGSTAAGARIVQWQEDHRVPIQPWRWKASSMVAGHSGLVAYAPVRGRQLVQVPFGQRSGSLAPQLFRIEGIAGGGNGFYRIVTGSSVLSVPGGATHDGAPLVTEQWGGTSNQLWKIEPVPGQPGYHRVVNAHSGKVMDVSTGSRVQGALIHQWRWVNGGNQMWKL